MKLRDVVIFSGQAFSVPQCIQRIDTRSTHGWQVRYNGTKFYSDGTTEGSGAAASLAAATQELLRRISEQPAPISVKTTPCVHKTSDLPSGISGPITRSRPGRRSRVVEFSVNLPRFAQPPKRRSVYIGTEQAVTPARYDQALAKAIALRTKAEQDYQEEATRFRRLAALSLQQPGLTPVAVAPAPAPVESTASPAAPKAAKPRAARGSKTPPATPLQALVQAQATVTPSPAA
jgi:hypothetical protein